MPRDSMEAIPEPGIKSNKINGLGLSLGVMLRYTATDRGGKRGLEGRFPRQALLQKIQISSDRTNNAQTKEWNNKMIVYRLAISLALLALVAPGVSAPAHAWQRPSSLERERGSAPTSGQFAELTKTLEDDIARHSLLDRGPTKVPGMVVFVVDRSGIVYRGYFGRYRSDPVLPIASATKVVSAATVMTLVDAGKLDLDKPISDYLNWWQAPDKRDMTLRQLLSHTAALPGLDHNPRCIGDQGNSQSLGRCAREIEKVALIGKPGQIFAYGGADYQVAGAVVEAVTGQRWSDYFQQAIAAPCDMSDFSYNKGAHNPRIAGGGYSNAESYARFLQVFLNGGKCGSQRILSQKAMETMEQNVIGSGMNIGFVPAPAAIPPYGYGLGWWIDPPSEGGRIFSDPGLLGATPWIDRTHGYAAIILTLAGTKKGVAIQQQIAPVIVRALAQRNRVHP